jgi:hypothetical protein
VVVLNLTVVFQAATPKLTTLMFCKPLFVHHETIMLLSFSSSSIAFAFVSREVIYKNVCVGSETGVRCEFLWDKGRRFLLKMCKSNIM